MGGETFICNLGHRRYMTDFERVLLEKLTYIEFLWEVHRAFSAWKQPIPAIPTTQRSDAAAIHAEPAISGFYLYWNSNLNLQIRVTSDRSDDAGVESENLRFVQADDAIAASYGEAPGPVVKRPFQSNFVSGQISIQFKKHSNRVAWTLLSSRNLIWHTKVFGCFSFGFIKQTKPSCLHWKGWR